MARRQNSFTNLGTDFAARARDITTCLREEGYNTCLLYTSDAADES